MPYGLGELVDGRLGIHDCYPNKIQTRKYIFLPGYAYHELGQYENAVANYTKAIQIDPDDGLAYNYWGYTYWRITQKGKFREDRRKACSLNSRYCGLYE